MIFVDRPLLFGCRSFLHYCDEASAVMVWFRDSANQSSLRVLEPEIKSDQDRHEWRCQQEGKIGIREGCHSVSLYSGGKVILPRLIKHREQYRYRDWSCDDDEKLLHVVFPSEAECTSSCIENTS